MLRFGTIIIGIDITMPTIHAHKVRDPNPTQICEVTRFQASVGGHDLVMDLAFYLCGFVLL